MSAPSAPAQDPIVVTSPAQAEAWRRRESAPVEEVADGVWAIPVPIPGGGIPTTLSYALIGEDGVHLIDPGWGGERTRDTLERALLARGRRIADVRTVVVTHFHPDHLGAADGIRRESGAALVLSGNERRVLARQTHPSASDEAEYRSRLEEWGVPDGRRAELLAGFDRPSLVEDAEPDLLVADGDELRLAGRVLEVVATPGHTGGHVCLADRAARLLFTGDHVLPQINSGVGIGSLPGDEPLGDLLSSLERLAEFDDFEVLPGHEYRFTGLGSRRRQIAAHHLRRTAEVAAVADELGDAPIWQYARRLTWTAGWDALTDFSLHSALQQTQMHRDLVRSGRADELFARYGITPGG